MAVILNRSNFAPRGHLAMSKDIFGCYNRGMVLASIDRDQGCCLTSYIALGNPHNKGLASPKCQ